MDGACLDADGVVLATDVAGLQQIVENSSTLGDDEWRKSVAKLGNSATIRGASTLAGQKSELRPGGFRGDRRAAPAGQCQRAGTVRARSGDVVAPNGGSVVELHSYAVKAPDDDLRDRLLARLRELYPETRRARIVGETVLRHNDCPRFAPGDFADRPGVVTPHDGLALAGDGIRIDLPVALMERAATTGWSAANRPARVFRDRRPPTADCAEPGPLGASEPARQSRKGGQMSKLADLASRWTKKTPFAGTSVVSMVRATTDVSGSNACHHRRRHAPVTTPSDGQLVRVRGQRRHPKPTAGRLGRAHRNWSLGAAQAAPCT